MFDRRTTTKQTSPCVRVCILRKHENVHVLSTDVLSFNKVVPTYFKFAFQHTAFEALWKARNISIQSEHFHNPNQTEHNLNPQHRQEITHCVQAMNVVRQLELITSTRLDTVTSVLWPLRS